MKKLFVILIFFCFSCKQTYYLSEDGKKYSQRKINRVTKRSVKKAIKSLSKEEKESLEGVKLIVEFQDSTK